MTLTGWKMSFYRNRQTGELIGAIDTVRDEHGVKFVILHPTAAHDEERAMLKEDEFEQLFELIDDFSGGSTHAVFESAGQAWDLRLSDHDEDNVIYVHEAEAEKLWLALGHALGKLP
jgi:hypothetical protein